VNDLDHTMMQRAIALARQAGALGEVPVAAVIYRDGDIIAQAHNRRELDQDPTAHAEMLAMRDAAKAIGSWRLENCSMAVTLEPCAMCAGALVNARIARLVYGASDPKMGCVDTLYQLCTDSRFNHRIEAHAGVLADECGAMLSQFFAARRGPEKPPKPRAS